MENYKIGDSVPQSVTTTCTVEPLLKDSI